MKREFVKSECFMELPVVSRRKRRFVKFAQYTASVIALSAFGALEAYVFFGLLGI